MNFKDFVYEHQALVISYDADLFLEECGFDFRVAYDREGLREYYKLIQYQGEVIEIIFDSNEDIYITQHNNQIRVNIVPYIVEKIGEIYIPEFIKTNYFIYIIQEMINRLIIGDFEEVSRMRKYEQKY